MSGLTSLWERSDVRGLYGFPSPFHRAARVLSLLPCMFTRHPPPLFRFKCRPMPPSVTRSARPTRAPSIAHGCCYHLSYDQLHELCERRGYGREDSKNLLALMGEGDRNCKTAEGDAADVSVALTGRRDRAPAVVAEIWKGSRDTRGSDAAWVISTWLLSQTRRERRGAPGGGILI